jgi:hypothetical protein
MRTSIMIEVVGAGGLCPIWMLLRRVEFGSSAHTRSVRYARRPEQAC